MFEINLIEEEFVVRIVLTDLIPSNVMTSSVICYVKKVLGTQHQYSNFLFNFGDIP